MASKSDALGLETQKQALEELALVLVLEELTLAAKTQAQSFFNFPTRIHSLNQSVCPVVAVFRSDNGECVNNGD